MRVGPYEVLNEIGRGGMGVVCKARAPSGNEVALKFLTKKGKDSVARFEREVRLQLTLGEEGSGFVPVLDFGDSEHGPWIVMPLLGGGTLRERVEKKPLTIDETVAIGKLIGRTIGAAHRVGIVHRDLKPENIIFDVSGTPYVADLGIAKHFSNEGDGASQSVQLTRKGEMKGTAGYMSVEQLEDSSEVGPPTDVFAAGAILYECLTGQAAFTSDTLLEVVARIEQGQLTPVQKLRPDTPAWLAAVIERALARDAVARFPDGAAFCAAIEAGERGETTEPARVAAAPAGHGKLIALGVVALLVAAAAVVFFLHRRP